MAKAGTTAATVRPGLRFLDRLILLVAWVVTCGLVYGLGFYTGKGTQERRLGMEERVVRLPVTAEVPPEGQRPKATNEFSFYETLATQRASEGPGRREVLQDEAVVAAVPPSVPQAAAPVGQPLPSPMASPGAPKPSAVATGAPKPPVPGAPSGRPVAAPTGTVLAKPALPTPLGAPKPSAVATGQPKPPVPARMPASDGVIPPTPRGASGAGTTRPAGTPIATVPAAATRSPTTAPAPTPRAPAPGAMVALAKPTPPATAPAAPRKPAWTVQASPTRDRAEVTRLQASLKSRGYEANVVTVRRDGDTWYRLRVGRYASPEEATEAMRKLRSAGVSHAFVASE